MMRSKKSLFLSLVLWLPLQAAPGVISVDRVEKKVHVDDIRVEKIKNSITKKTKRNKYIKIGLYALPLAIVAGFIYNWKNGPGTANIQQLSAKMDNLGKRVSDLDNKLVDCVEQKKDKGLSGWLSGLATFSWTSGIFLAQQVFYGRAFKSLDSFVDSVVGYPGDLRRFINKQTTLCHQPNDFRYFNELHYYADIIDNKALYAPRKVKYAKDFLLDARYQLVNQIEKILGYMEYKIHKCNEVKNTKDKKDLTILHASVDYLTYCTNQISYLLYECVNTINSPLQKVCASEITQFKFELESIIDRFMLNC